MPLSISIRDSIQVLSLSILPIHINMSFLRFRQSTIQEDDLEITGKTILS